MLAEEKTNPLLYTKTNPLENQDWTLEQGTKTDSCDIVSGIPTEVAVRIFSFLAVPDLIIAGETCRTWRSISLTDSLWRSLCQERWKDKVFCPFTLHPLVDYTPYVSQLKVKEIKAVLDRRRVTRLGLFEKSELIKLLLGTLPPYAPKSQPWKSKWQASYIVAEHDSKRTIIYDEDLCYIKWTFEFTSGWPEEIRTWARFCSDNTYMSGLFDRKCPWRRVAGNHVQVAEYDPLFASRREDDWSWELRNQYVLFSCRSGEMYND